jgi:hypothetical protein
MTGVAVNSWPLTGSRFAYRSPRPPQLGELSSNGSESLAVLTVLTIHTSPTPTPQHSALWPSGLDYLSITYNPLPFVDVRVQPYPTQRNCQGQGGTWLRLLCVYLLCLLFLCEHRSREEQRSIASG